MSSEQKQAWKQTVFIFMSELIKLWRHKLCAPDSQSAIYEVSFSIFQLEKFNCLIVFIQSHALSWSNIWKVCLYTDVSFPDPKGSTVGLSSSSPPEAKGMRLAVTHHLFCGH